MSHLLRPTLWITLALGTLLGACAASSEQAAPPAAGASATAPTLRATAKKGKVGKVGKVGKGCKGLCGTLNAVASAADPAATATAKGVDWVDGRVRVAAELESGAAPSFGGGVTEELRSGGLVQLLVAPGDLCRVAGLDGVKKLRAPKRAKPKGGAAPSTDPAAGTE